VVAWQVGVDVEAAGGGEGVGGELHRAPVPACVVGTPARDDQTTHPAPVLEQVPASGSEGHAVLGPSHDGRQSQPVPRGVPER